MVDWVPVLVSDITSGLVVFKASNVMVAGWLMSENSRQSLHFIGVQWSARMNWANPIIRRSRDQIFLHECWSHECKKVTWVWKAILIFPMLWFRRCDENKILPFVALLLVVDSKPWSIPVSTSYVLNYKRRLEYYLICEWGIVPTLLLLYIHLI